MLRLILVSILSLLACACARPQVKPDPMRGSWLRTIETEKKQWGEMLNGTIGTHISKLIDIWGEPERYGKPDAYEYSWAKHIQSKSGGYYRSDGYTTQRVYDEYGSFKGTIETPKEHYVPVSTYTFWCNIRINTDKCGIITHVRYDDTSNDGGICRDDFPFPEDFPPK